MKQKNWISEVDDKLWEQAWNADNNKNIQSEMGRARETSGTAAS